MVMTTTNTSNTNTDTRDTISDDNTPTITLCVSTVPSEQAIKYVRYLRMRGIGTDRANSISTPMIRCVNGALSDRQITNRILFLSREITTDMCAYILLTLCNSQHLSESGRRLCVCEWNPVSTRPARTFDMFHGFATRYMGKGDRRLRVCAWCAKLDAVKKWTRSFMYKER